MLGYALIEIRSPNDLQIIKALADIFHNLPGSLNNWDSEMHEQAYHMIIDKAKKWKLESYIIKLRVTAESNLSIS